MKSHLLRNSIWPLLIALFLPAWVRGKEPLPADAPAAAAYVKVFNDLELKIGDEYVRLTKDPPELQDAAKKLLVDVKKRMLGLPAKMSLPQVQIAAAYLISEGSRDPLILAVSVQSQPDLTKKDELTATCKEAIAGVLKQYRLREQADVIDRCQNVLFDIANKYRAERGKYPYPDRNQLGDAYVRWIAAEADSLDAQRRIWTLLNFQFRDRSAYRGNELVYIAEKSREVKVHPWLRHMLDGHTEYHNGRKLYLDNDENFKPMFRKAGEHYTQAWKIAPQFPQAAAELIQIARGGHVPESPRDWFDRAVAAELDNKDAYAYFRTYLRSQGPDELISFGIECANTRRFDTMVPLSLIDCVWAIENHNGENGYVREGVYEAVRDVCQEAYKAPTFIGIEQTDATRAWIVSLQIAVAARAGRFEDVSELLKKTNPVSLQAALRAHNVSMSQREIKAAGEAALLVGAKLINEVEEVLRKAKDEPTIAAALDKIEAAEKELGADHSRVRNWRDRAAIYQKFYSGQWAEVTFPEDAVKLSDAQKWTRVDEKTMLSRGVNPFPLTALTNIQTPYEFTYEISTVDMPPDVTMAGVQVGRKYPAPNRREYGIFVGLTSPQNQVGWRNGKFDIGTALLGRYSVPCKKVNEIRVRVWDGYFDYFVNNERIVSQIDPQFDPGGIISLVTLGDPEASPIVRYSNIRVRELTFDAPPYRTRFEERVEYFSERIKEEPEIVEYYRDRGDDYLFLNRPADAMKDFAHLLKTRPESPEAMVRVGKAHAALGEYQKAVDRYAQAMKANPGYHLAYDRLAWLRATCQDETFRDGTKAVELANQAIKIADRIQLYKVTLVAALAEQGEFKKAQDLMERTKNTVWRDDLPRVQPVIDQINANKPYRAD